MLYILILFLHYIYIYSFNILKTSSSFTVISDDGH
jgi:hypothetical protein